MRTRLIAGSEIAELVLLNDFHVNPSMIAWTDMLQLSESDIVHLPVPKSFCKQDLEFHEDLLFFTTADAPVVLVIRGVYLSIKFQNYVSSLDVFSIFGNKYN